MNHLKISDQQSAAAPSTATIATANATVFTLSPGEVGVIQNLDDAALAVKLGTGASPTSLSFILPAGTAADDGTSPPVYITDYSGAVSVAAMTGDPRFIAWKRALS